MKIFIIKGNCLSFYFKCYIIISEQKMAVDRFFTVSFSEFERDFPLDRKRLTSRHFDENYKNRIVNWHERNYLNIHLNVYE
jgi:hypothetical protein